MRKFRIRINKAVALAAILALSAVVASVRAADAQAAPRFVDATAVAGLDHTYDGGDAFVVGGGAAALDCDDDGDVDLFLAGGERLAGLWRNVAEPGGPAAFEPVEAFGLAPEDAARVIGAYPLDVDGDARLDLFVLRFGRNVVLRGVGDCRFEDATDALGLPEQSDYSTAFAAFWAPGDAAPTMAIGNYVDRDRPLQRRGNCQDSYLLRPGADGRYGAPEPLDPSACALSMLFVDWSGAGAGSFLLRIANDRAYFDPGLGEQLFRVDDDGATALGPDDGWDGPSLWGMGLAAQDIDGDGRPEIAVTNMADNHLQALAAVAAGPSYVNRSFELGLMSHRPYVGPDLRPSTSWHVEFQDFNNDGYADLWIVKGNVDQMPDFAAFDPDSLLLGGPDGVFREAGFEAGLAVPGTGRGGVAIDLNRDGLLDLVVINRGEPARVHQQIDDGAGGGSVRVALRQDGPNAFAIGARIEVETDGRRRVFDLSVGGGHASGSASPTHIGLGDAEEARLRVRWPDGAWSDWRAVADGEDVVIRRGDGR